jgi:hypothetical protein
MAVQAKDEVRFVVSDEQWKLGHEIGMARNLAKDRIDPRRSSSGGVLIHVTGAVAEVVFAGWQGFRVDNTVHRWKGDDYDFLSRMGETVDVKTYGYVGAGIELKELQRYLDAKGPKHVYVCSRYHMDRNRVAQIDMVGWIFGLDLLKHGTPKRYGDGNDRYPLNRVVGTDRLSKFSGKFFGRETVDDPAVVASLNEGATE